MTARGNGARRARLEAEAGAAGVGIGALTVLSHPNIASARIAMLEPQLSGKEAPAPLFSTDDNFADARRKLIADKALDPSAATDDPEAST